ncbi:hypothetical protein TNCT_690931 [Trichonephila clavata]|uniref:Uncharacterized protein n=1 Tax=Trichonephila clavata TaxID=2740835 RepID=A0A8X6FFP0_TRICU|nr:hypothetical protein TNCT_690931 [Trichonephila clavata]
MRCGEQGRLTRFSSGGIEFITQSSGWTCTLNWKTYFCLTFLRELTLCSWRWFHSPSMFGNRTPHSLQKPFMAASW